jgi:3-oxoadipate enol-lactonase
MGLSWHEVVQFARMALAPTDFASTSVSIWLRGGHPRLELILSLQSSTGLRARMRDGTAIRYAISGEGMGPPIALIHSLAMDRYFWNAVVDLMKPSATLLSYDCRGHGESDKPAGPYSVKLFADDLHDLLNHIGWTSAIVAGASIGGSVALGFATKYPAQVSGLGLFDTTAWYGPDAPEDWDGRAVKAKQDGLAGLVGFQKTRWFGEAFREQHPEIVEASVATFLRNDVVAYAETCRMLGNFDLRSELNKITVPTAVAVGEEDYATTPAMAGDLHAGIRNSTLTVIEGGRHLTPLEKPGAIAAQLDALLKRAGQ